MFDRLICLDAAYVVVIIIGIICLAVYQYKRMTDESRRLISQIQKSRKSGGCPPCVDKECPVSTCPTPVCPTCPEQKCPDVVCPAYPVQQPTVIQHTVPIVPNVPIFNIPSEFRQVGYMYRVHEQNSSETVLEPKYKVLPLYAKPYRGDFFFYFVEYKSDGQMFRKTVTRESGRHSSDDKSREIYDGDTIDIGIPINGKYIFREEQFNRY